MFRTPTSRLRRVTSGEAGFTLVEVMAAMVVFAIVATAVTAMFASGLRASLLTKMETTAKNLSQQRFEGIRNLPFHVDQVAAGNNPPDLLDTYYTNTTTLAGGRGKHGFVPNGTERWTDDGDPETGAFFRYVQKELPGYAKFTQYVATQFLDDAGNPFSPSAFDALTAGFDQPPTMVVGVSVTTLWKSGNLDRVSRVYSQVTSGRPTAPNAVLQSQLTALRMTGGLTAGRTVTADLASLNADGSLSRVVSAGQSLKAASLVVSTTGSVAGAVTTVKAPPNAGPLGSSSGPKGLVEASNTVAHVGNTRTANVSATSSTGQVVLNTQTSPATADVLGGGAGDKIAYIRVPSDQPSLGLLDTQVYLEDAGCGGSCSNAGVSGWASTASSSTLKSTTTSASAFVRGAVVFMPTTFAPLGLVRVKLDEATVGCKVTHSSGSDPVATATATYSGTLSYWAPFDPLAVAGYVTTAISSSQAASPLTPELLATTQVGTDLDGEPLWLSDYVSGWQSLDSTTAESAKTFGPDGTTVSTTVNGVVSISSVQLRPGDEGSVVAAELAPGGCTAEDYR